MAWSTMRYRSRRPLQEALRGRLRQLAATYVRYRDQWFWIDDKDYQSKTIFAFIVHLLSLAEGEKTQQLPVITIPVG